MKKLLILFVVIATVFTLSTAHATLLGVKDFIESAPFPGIVPDILYDSGGYASYDAPSGFFFVQAWDKNLWLSKPGTGIALSNYVDFNINAWFDGGKFVEGYMVEFVNTNFEFTVGQATYSFVEGDLFLGAWLTAIGWDEVNKNQFDYITENYIYGVLSEDY